MSYSMLKPSSTWFLCPEHLRTKTDTNCKVSFPSPKQKCTVPLEEEFFIRKYCPVTLNHLLPDLCLTLNCYSAKGEEDFNVGLLKKFENHLNDSHKAVSCCSSTEMPSEEELEEENGDELMNYDRNLYDEKSRKQEPNNKLLLKPHKVNYPEENMHQLILPNVFLNNRKSTIWSSYKKKNKQCAKDTNYFQSIHPSENILFPFVDGTNRQPFYRASDAFYNNDRNEGIDNSTKNRNYFSHLPRNFGSRSPMFQRKPSPTESASRTRLSRPALCVYHRRSRSLSPAFKKCFSFRNVPSTLPAAEKDREELLPSPHLLELARLKRMELKIEEQIILRERRRLEIERLRPPAVKWYEMKSKRFHQEAHQNVAYLRNERFLPLIQEKRRLLKETLAS